MRCSVCNKEFEPLKENKYIVTKFSFEKIKKEKAFSDTFDAFDCPFCGCQIIAGNRYLNVSEVDKIACLF